MIVVDTSAWVEYLRGTGSAVHRAVRELIARDTALAVPDVVRLELLAGAADPAVPDLLRLLARFDALPAASPADHELAASLYRAARRSGRTVRSLVDCLIAAAALRIDAEVLALDRDYDLLASISELRLTRVT